MEKTTTAAASLGDGTERNGWMDGLKKTFFFLFFFVERKRKAKGRMN